MMREIAIGHKRIEISPKLTKRALMFLGGDGASKAL